MSANPEPPIPDPNGPPVASKQMEKIVKRSASFSAIVVVGGTAALIIIACVSTPTMGALRSQRIQWQERQEEISDVLTRSNDAPAMPQIVISKEIVHE